MHSNDGTICKIFSLLFCARDIRGITKEVRVDLYPYIGLDPTEAPILALIKSMELVSTGFEMEL